MDTHRLPPEALMREAFLAADAAYDGIFWAGVRSTGIFCRPSCAARKPRPENLTFFATSEAALRAGFRACKRCRPLEAVGSEPPWLAPLMGAVAADPHRRWTEEDLRALGLAPERVRRWFQRAHGMTFHAYQRARRMGEALEQVQSGARVGRVAFESGYDSLSGFQEGFRAVFGAPPTELGSAPLVKVARVPTPLGAMVAGATEEALCFLEFADRPALASQISRIRKALGAVFVPAASALAERVRREMEEYFGGGRSHFEVPHRAVGTGFQQEVWACLAEIPYGETRSYADVAAAVGRPSAVRAVGSANGANPLSVVVPCHRVVGADGRLSGYGGGLWRKRRLLELERSSSGSATDP